MSRAQDNPAPSAGKAGREGPQGRPRTGLLRPRARRAANPEARMPLIEHIRELRSRVIKAMLAVAAGSIGGGVIFPPPWKGNNQPYFPLPPPSLTTPGATRRHPALH